MLELNRKTNSAWILLPCYRLRECGKVGLHIFWTCRRKRGFDRRRLLSSHKLFLMRRWQRYWARFSFQQQQLILLERAVPPCSYSISKHHKTRRRSMEVKAISTTLKVSKGTVPCQNWAEKWGREMTEDLYQDLRQPDSWDIFILYIVFIFRFWDFMLRFIFISGEMCCKTRDETLGEAWILFLWGTHVVGRKKRLQLPGYPGWTGSGMRTPEGQSEHGRCFRDTAREARMRRFWHTCTEERQWIYW